MMRVRKTAIVRWIAPAAVAVLLVGGSVGVNAITASAGSGALPPRTAAQLLIDVEQAKLGALSGTVVQTSDLGIPSLPGLGGADSSSLTSLISGTHTLRLWYDGTDKARIALLGTLGETDVIKNGGDLWTWSSKDNEATHRTVNTTGSRAATAGKSPMNGLSPTDLPKTPQEAADAVLAAVDPSTTVSTDGGQRVAGRAVYQLTLRPKDTQSLVTRVSIAIDASEHIPLRVQVFGADTGNPAFEVAFSSVDFATPDAAQFTFNPPPGAKVTQITSGSDPAPAVPGTKSGRPDSVKTSGVAPRVVGKGWTSVLVASSSAVAGSGQLGGILGALPEVTGAWGSGRLLAGTLFSFIVTSDGRVAAGAVAPDLLYKALATK